MKRILKNIKNAVAIFFCSAIFFILSSSDKTSSISRATGLAQNFPIPAKFLAPPVRSLILKDTMVVDQKTGYQLRTLYSQEMKPKLVTIRTTIVDSLGCDKVSNNGEARLKVYRRRAYDCSDTCPTASLSAGTCSFRTSTPREQLCGNNEDTIALECTVELPYYAEPTDLPGQEDDFWVAEFEVQDSKRQIARDQTSFEIANLRAITSGGSTEFGKVEIDTVSKPVTLTLTNSGNLPISLVEIKGTPLKCARNTLIQPDALRFSFSPQTPFEQMTPLPLTGSAHVAVAIDKSVNGSTSSRKLYWRLKVPRGISGKCNGKISYVAVK